MTNLFRRILSLPRLIKQTIMILFDILFLEISIISAYSLRQAALFWPGGDLEKLVYISPFLAIPIFYFFGLYQSVVRYMGIKAILFIFYAVTVYMIVWSLIGFNINVEVPRSVLIYHDDGTIYKVTEYFSGFFVLCIIIWLISLTFIGTSRLIIRQIYWGIKYGFFDYYDDRKNIIIYGSGDAGIQLANALYFSKELKPVAFIDDNKSLTGKYISDIKIYSFEKIENLIKKFNVKEILISIPSLNSKDKLNIIDKLKIFPVVVSSLPGISQIAEQGIIVESRQKVKIDDILGRDQVIPDLNLLKKNIRNKNILVTGAGGSIGSELCRQIIKYSPKSLILFEQTEYALYKVEESVLEKIEDLKIKIYPFIGDIRDKNKIKTIIKNFKIKTIFHAAAYKHVPMVEMNIMAAFENNVLGTLCCVEAASEMKINNFVLISTDKAVRPTNIMGATKRVSEMIVQSYAAASSTKFSVVRFGNVLGSSGSVIPLFERQIEKGGPVTVTHKDIERYFMTVQEAAQLVIQASAIKTKGNIFVLDMGKPIKILDLAKKMIELSGFTWTLNNDKHADISINITGLRPGEKLFEELAISNKTYKTSNPKIISIDEDYVEKNKLKRLLMDIDCEYTKSNIKNLKLFLMKIVKDYKPNSNIADNLISKK